MKLDGPVTMEEYNSELQEAEEQELTDEIEDSALDDEGSETTESLGDDDLDL